MTPSPSNDITDPKDMILSTEKIYKYAKKICNAYEHLISRYELLSIENIELKKNGSVKAPEDSFTTSNTSNRGHKRRKTDESLINDSIASNDPLNEAIQGASGYLDDEIIESTPKPDVSKKNVSKRPITFKSPPNKRTPIKVEKFDDTNEEASLDAQRTEFDKKPQSPLKSVENQRNAGKENQNKKRSTWMSNVMVSPSRVSRSGFISAKSPKGVARLSLSKPFKQSLLEFPKKTTKETTNDTCVETFYDGTPPRQIVAPLKQIVAPPKQIGDVKAKFLHQPCLETCIRSSKDSDDETMFSFKTHDKPNTTSSISPPNIKLEPTNIKLEPQTGLVKSSNVTNSKITAADCQTSFDSSSSSVVALSGQKCEVIVIEESQPLFDDFSETFCDKLELKDLDSRAAVNERRICENESLVANHNISCNQCTTFMASNPHLTIEERLIMVDKCNKYAKRQDTDPEYWNPRFLPTPESQKQETLIDDRWTTRRKKS